MDGLIKPAVGGHIPAGLHGCVGNMQLMVVHIKMNVLPALCCLDGAHSYSVSFDSLELHHDSLQSISVCRTLPDLGTGDQMPAV